MVLPLRFYWTSSSMCLDVLLSLGRPARKLLVTARNWAFCCPFALRSSCQGLWGLVDDTHDVPHRGGALLSPWHTQPRYCIWSVMALCYQQAELSRFWWHVREKQETHRVLSFWVSTSSFSMRVCVSENCLVAALGAWLHKSVLPLSSAHQHNHF